MRMLLNAAVVAMAIGTSACSATGDAGYAPPIAPTPGPTPASGVVTIDIAEINGPSSFYPSPATVRNGQTVVWRNTDTTTHHVVLDDGSVDTGTVAPGTLTQPQTIGPGARSYHCTIHPSMTGTITVAAQ